VREKYYSLVEKVQLIRQANKTLNITTCHPCFFLQTSAKASGFPKAGKARTGDARIGAIRSTNMIQAYNFSI
jgi:hypothetical protein